MSSIIRAYLVIPAKAGIQKKPGFPSIKYGAGLVKPGMTGCIRLMSSYINGIYTELNMISLFNMAESCLASPVCRRVYLLDYHLSFPPRIKCGINCGGNPERLNC